MRLITESEILVSEFIRLMREYDSYYWSTAWAGIESLPFKELILQKRKIKKIVVGIHFFQTHPDFIAEFLYNDKVKYIKQPNGTFHPKVYLFINDNNNWEVIIGSANFTKQAFTSNTEAVMLINNHDSNSQDVLRDTLLTINLSWPKANTFNQIELENYKKIWRNQKYKIDSLSGNYGATSEISASKSIHTIDKSVMSWADFVKEVCDDKIHNFNDRLEVIKLSHSLFHNVTQFKFLNEDERKFIAGLPNKLNDFASEHYGYFGSMKGRGNFAHEIIQNNTTISEALDEIPLFGQITKSNYDRYISKFQKVFPGNYLGTATRLLSMKRPDIFVCLDSKNIKKLCNKFGIVKYRMDYEKYWNEIIMRIYDSEWWLNSEPANSIEREIYNARAAFLDSLFYLE